jgi:hypothetical protein
MAWSKVFLIVTGGALAGMVMGGLFGVAAGSIAPNLFKQIIPWADVEARGVATILGAVAGVLLGGGLSVFGIAVQFLGKMWNRSPETSRLS